MNIIKNVIRKFGFDVVRYSNPQKPIGNVAPVHTTGKSKGTLISTEFANEALNSVGRKLDIPIFTYYERPHKSSDKMEEAENKWWNAHGELIENVWVLSDEINHLYRSPYVSKAADFFTKQGKKARVLDLGCGSGWFGRMIAGEMVEYVGMDFSSTQIAIANQNKSISPNKEYLNYYCATDIENIPDLQNTTGVIIHAFLHHLYLEDLKKLFDKLHSILPVGCKFFIVEPIYPDLIDFSEEQKEKKKYLFSAVNSLRKYIIGKKEELVSKRQYDLGTETELNEIMKESSANGFFFSPKEVPFKMNEFRKFLENYLIIEDCFFCGVTNLEVAQFIERVADPISRKNLINTLIPVSEKLDKLLLSEGYFELFPSSYLFTSFECILKKN